MTKIYTISLLLLTFSVFAQNKIKETATQGLYFKQENGQIQVWNGYPTENGLALVNSGIPPSSSFSSPNEVIITEDAAGNKYWYIIDGTLVKSEIVSRSSNTSSTEIKAPVSETKPIKEKAETPIEHKISAPVAEPAIKEEASQPLKAVETSPAKDKQAPVIEEKSKLIIIEEVKQPEVEQPKVTEGITTPEPNQDNVNTDITEEIRVTTSEAEDVSNLFEKNYDDMSRKEKKLYKKNEKKIMKQLEKELKSKKDDTEE